MDKSVFTIWLLCLPGLLSASCSSGSSGGGSSPYSGDPHFYNPDLMLNNPSAYFPSGLHDFDTSKHHTSSDAEPRGDECKNGWCGEDGSCICNPCWSGPTCQEYVDRFAPRFLAEEPFFIVDASASGSGGYTTFLDPAFDPIYPQWPIPTSYSSSPSDFVEPANSWATSSQNPVQQTAPSLPHGQVLHQQHQTSPSPLFRIESADDDLGLTCQLGQVGPAATCPCATPRYKVVGATTTFPDSLSSPKSEFNSESYSSSDEMSKDNNPFGNPTSPRFTSSQPDLHFEDQKLMSARNEQSKTNQSHDHNNNLFWANEETGDVFLHEGFKLQPSKHYFITLQVSALHVNNSGFKPWKDEVVATLYVRPSSGQGKTRVSRSDQQQMYTSLDDLVSMSRPEENGMKTKSKFLTTTSSSDDGEEDKDVFGTSKSSEVYFNSKEDSTKSFDSDLSNSQFPQFGDTEGGNENETPFLSDTNKRDFGKSKQTYSRRIMRSGFRNSKNKLPYALRGDRPHYKFEDYQQGDRSAHTHSDSENNINPNTNTNSDPNPNSDSNVANDRDQLLQGEDDHSFLHRWKRQSLLYVPDDFELTLSRLTESIAATERFGFGDKIKMQLVIQVPSVDSVDFDIEILSSKDDPRFAILSAHVSSIGSDISFDKDQTNLAPILKPSKNISLYDSAVWHWKSVKRAKTEQSRNKGITIDFDIVPVRMTVGGGSYSNISRRNPLLQLSSLPTSSSLSKSRGPQRTNVSPLGKMTKDFNTYLLPIRARLSFPLAHDEHPGSNGNDQIGHHHPDKSKQEKISQRLFKVFVNTTTSRFKNSLQEPSPLFVQHHTHSDKNLNQITTEDHRLNALPSGVGNKVQVELAGPREIPQGEWKSYTIKVYLQHPSQFKLTMEQIEGNEISDQDSISVGDIRLVKIGKSITSCTEIPEKPGFRVSCKKLPGGRKGDLCSVESPPLNFCPRNHRHETSGGLAKILNADDNVLVMGEDDEEQNVIKFEGVVYGLPGTAPGSKFTLRAHIKANYFLDDPTKPPNSKSHTIPNPSTSSTLIVEDQTKLQGKITKRKLTAPNNLRAVLVDKNGNMNDDDVDGKISIMPNTDGGNSGKDMADSVGHFRPRRTRRRRSIFPSSVVFAKSGYSLLKHRQSASDRSLQHRKSQSYQSTKETGRQHE